MPKYSPVGSTYANEFAIHLRAFDAKTYWWGFERGNGPFTLSRKFSNFLKKMVPGDASSATVKIYAVHGWIGYLDGQYMGTTIHFDAYNHAKALYKQPL